MGTGTLILRSTSLALILLSVTLAGGCDKNADARGATNVLLIVADDLGYNDLAINNANPDIHTPALDQLAREGVRFVQHYADSVCSPSRAALLTGMHPSRLGFVPNARGISPQITTLAEALQARGYRTWHVGKWHIGDTVRAAWPDHQGFDHWFGFLDQWLLAGVHENGVLVPARPRYEDPWLMSDGDAGRHYQGNLDDILTGKAVATIAALAESPSEPWFMNLWFYAPHAPVTPPAQFSSLYPDTPQGRYRALVHQLDYNTGRVLEALERSGQADSTLVVFVSDNGGTGHEIDSNFPYFGAKATFHEGGVRTPLLIRRRAESQPGSVRTDVVAIYDIYPTILAELGIEIPTKLDGRKLFGNGTPATNEPRTLFWEQFSAGHYGYSVLQQGHWRLYKGWPWVPWETPPSLVDYAIDPTTPRNQLEEQPQLAASMDAAWQHWHREIHQPTFDYKRDTITGAATLEGLDFLRTPGFGEFSFAIAIPESFQGGVASQQDIWSARIDTKNRLVVDFQGYRVQGVLPEDACRSVIVSGTFERRLSNWEGVKDQMTIHLYINGIVVDNLHVDGKLEDNQLAAPTRIGAGLGEPLLLSASVEGSEVWSPAGIHRQLCPSPPAMPQSGVQIK